MTDTMNPAEARAHTERMRSSEVEPWELLADLHQRRGWEALCYRTWEDYCAHEFGPDRSALVRGNRRGAVIALHHAGMSFRGIAAALGMGYGTVARDVSMATVGEALADEDSGRPLSAQTLAAISRRDAIRELAAQGMTRQQVAEMLGISRKRLGEITKAGGIIFGTTDRSKAAQQWRLRTIRERAAAGATSRQIADEVGVSAQRVRELARAEGIDIPSDAVARQTMRLDHTQIVRGAVEDTYGIGHLLDRVDWSQVDLTDAEHWIDSLTEAIRTLTALRRAVSKERQNRG